MDIPHRVGDGSNYGNWNGYVLGNRESLKKINEILDDVGKDDFYHYVDMVFGFIAKNRDESGLEDCRRKYNQELFLELSKFRGDRYLNYLALLLLYHRMYLEWEISLRHDAVHVLHGAVESYYRVYVKDLPEPEQAFIIRFLDLFKILACGMRIENALNVNCPLGILKHCEDIDGIPAAGLDATRFKPNERIVIGWLEGEIGNGRTYFQTVSQIAQVVLDWLKGDGRWRQGAVAAMAAAHEARRALVANSYFYATELDAQVTTLRRILEFGEAGQCKADFFKVIYCFPFVFHDFHIADPGKATKAIYESWKGWSETSEDGFAETFRPTSYDEVELTDVWASRSDHAEDDEENDGGSTQTIYNLHSINFQDIVIHDVGDSTRTIRLNCEIRLSSFGNHYIRFYATRGEESSFGNFKQIDGHELHRILRRSSSLCGKEPISTSDGAYTNFSDDPYHPRTNLLGIAEKLIELFDRLLRDMHNSHVTHDFAKTSRVIFSLAEFGESEPVDTEAAAHRETALQRIFMNPIGGPADRLEPWLSRDVPAAKPGQGVHAVPNLARSELGEGAHIYITANTAFIRLPSHAHFVCLDYEEMAEFVATIQPLYSDLTRRIGKTVKEALPLFDKTRPDRATAGPLSRTARRAGALYAPFKRGDAGGVKDLYLKLQKLAASAQKKILDIDSPAIVTNSVYRDYLDDMILNSSARHWRENLQQRTASVHEVIKGLAEHASQMADESTQRSRHVWNIAIGIMAFFVSVAALVVSLGQLTDMKIYCRAPTPGCWNYTPPERQRASPGDSPNSAEVQTPHGKTAQ